MKQYVVATASALVVLAAAATANAAIVNFGTGAPATVFADGTFSHDLSGIHPDGFYAYDGPYKAYNGYGQNGEYIDFTAPVTLQQLTLGNCAACFPVPDTFTVKLFDSSSALLDSRSISGSSTEETLVFDRPNVSRVEFTFDGAKGDYYGDGRQVAWYFVSDITYAVNAAVPEPAGWAMMIGGFGAMGAVLRRRRRIMAA